MRTLPFLLIAVVMLGGAALGLAPVPTFAAAVACAMVAAILTRKEAR